jgi:capsular exopolysaccharide synthesis family protein
VRSDDSIDLREVMNVFLRRRNLFLYIAIPVFLGILLAHFLRPYTPLYRATFDLGVSRERPVEGFFSTGSAETPTIQIGSVTQRVISSLLSVSLARRVVDSLGLYKYVKNADSDMAVDIKLKQGLKKAIGPLKLKVLEDGFVLTEDGNTIGKGALGIYQDIGPFELRVTPLSNIQDRTYELYVYPKDRIALALRNSLAIKVLEADKIEQSGDFEKVPFSGEGADKKLVTAKSIFPGMNLIGILRIDVHWGNPDDALKIANALSDQILISDRVEKSQQFTQSQVFIDSQLFLYQEKLTALEEQVKRFKESKNIADLKASTQALINQVSELETKKNQLQIEEKILVDLNNYLIKSDPNVDTTPNYAATMLSDVVLRNFYSQLLNTEAELKGRLKEYSSNHPKVMEIRATLDGLKEQLKDEIRKRIPTIRTEIESYESQIGALQAKLENVPVDEVSLARLERDRETAEKLYTFFAEKLEETRVQEAGVTSDLKIINPAIVSPNPVNSRRPALTMFLALVISMLAGGFAVFIAEYVDNTIKDPESLKSKIDLPIFAMIPVMHDTEARAGAAAANNGGKQQILFKSQPSKTEDLKVLDAGSPEFEAFRKLAMNLDFAHPEKKYRAIYLTSAGPEEGKTFVTLNLGIVLSKLGKRVMLIDTDFRKRSGHLTEIAKLQGKPGLFDALRGDLEPEDVKISLDTLQGQENSHVIQRLDLLPTGEVPPNPFVFLESDKMRDAVDILKHRYDYVIIDGVPILLFADAAYLADFTDGVLLTARYGKTDLKDLEHAKEILTTAKSNIIGLVLNSIPRTRGSYYYRYYQKHYSKYYRKD